MAGKRRAQRIAADALVLARELLDGRRLAEEGLVEEGDRSVFDQGVPERMERGVVKRHQLVQGMLTTDLHAELERLR